MADSETGASAPARTPPAHACLDPLLNALGWTGTPRDLNDALPEDGAVPDLETLIAALENLHFRAIRWEELNRGPADQALPGLLARADGDVWVIIESEEPGRYKVFQGRKKRLATVGAEGLKGQIYIVQGDREEAAACPKRNWLSWLSPLLRGEQQFLRRLCGLSLLINSLSLALPVYVLVVFDIGAGSRMTLALTMLSAVMALLIIMEMLLRDLRARSLARFAARLHGRVMEIAFERMMALPVQAGERASVAGLQSRLRSFEAVRGIFASPLPAGILDLPLAVLLVVAAFAAGGWLGWLVALAACVLTGLSALGVVSMRLKSRPAVIGNAQIGTFRNEMIAMLPVIRSSNAEEIWERRYGALSSLRLAAEAGVQRNAVSGATMAQAIAALTGVLILGFTANDVIRGELSTGALMMLLVIVWRLAALFQPILLHTSDLVLALHIGDQVRSLIRFPQEISRASTLPHKDISGRIELANATCRPTGADFPVLRKINMTADSGELVAVAGPPGAGQGTLMRLLANLHPPSNGHVRIDGIDTRQCDARRLRQRIALVSADQRLFAGSAVYNFRLVNPFADDDRIMAAIRDADLEEFFGKLEEGVATDLTERLRAGLSPVVRSKLRLARAYVQDAAVYLFDEPLQDLDLTGRRAFLNMLAGLKGRKTVVATTSDDEILNMADKIFVMKAGEIVKLVTRPTDYEDHAAKSLRSLLRDHHANAVKDDRLERDRLSAPRKLSR